MLFDELTIGLATGTSRLPSRRRGLFLLAYAERMSGLYGLFEDRLDPPEHRFGGLVTELWTLAETKSPTGSVEAALESMVPGEVWVVSGFYDGLAQEIGGMAIGACAGLDDRAIEGVPDGGAFEVIRVVLSEMRLGCLDPGSNEIGRRFEESLAEEPLVLDELVFWRALESMLARGASVDEVRRFALANRLDPTKLEPELSLGLEKDRRSASY